MTQTKKPEEKKQQPAKPKKNKPLPPHLVQNAYYTKMRDKVAIIEFHMNSGKVYKGSIASFDTYSIQILHNETKEPILLFKVNIEAMYEEGSITN